MAETALLLVFARVAASRLYLQVRWPSDVLGGVLVALFWTAGAVALTAPALNRE
ncbi:MAG: phosphatase PAP2 family protein [Gammaproteobacteria bacterium]